MRGKDTTPEQVKEMEYLRSHGMTNEQVARHMGLSYPTVLRHIGLQKGKVAEINEAESPPKKPYVVRYTAKEIVFDRSGATVTVEKSGNVAVEIGKDLLVFTEKGFRDFVADMQIALEV